MKNELIEFIKRNSFNGVYIHCSIDFYNKNRDLILRGIERKLFIPASFNESGECNLIFSKWCGVDKLDGIEL